jgi:hypothetical protein
VVRHRDRVRAAEAARLAEQEQMSAAVIAARVGAHERTVRRWLADGGVRLRPGPRRISPRRPARQAVSADAARALRTAWDALPPPPRGGDGHDLNCADGTALLAALSAHRREGVTAASLGRVLGVSGQYIRRITSREAGDE